jgi:hypothetical protein
VTTAFDDYWSEPFVEKKPITQITAIRADGMAERCEEKDCEFRYCCGARRVVIRAVSGLACRTYFDSPGSGLAFSSADGGGPTKV